MDNHLRICIVTFLFWPDVGGAQARAEKQARQLQSLGHEVIVVTLQLNKQWKRSETLNGLLVVRVGGVFRWNGWLHIGRLGIWPVNVRMFLTLWRLRHRYDVIHSIQISSLAAVATLIGKLTHKPVIISSQNTGPNEQQSKQLEQGATLMVDTLNGTDKDFLKIDPSMSWVVGGSDITELLQTTLGGHAILHFLRNSSACYQVLSSSSYSYIISQGFRPENIVRISGSVDTEKFRPDPERQPDPASPERTIICVARLDYSKGVDVLLHAWARMLRAPADWRTHLKLRLKLVGDGTFKRQMERIADELGILDSVEFLGLRTDIVDLLQESWGFVLPSRWECMPNALLEAMACGLPCVATRVSGSENIISHGVNGLLLEPEQPAEMAQALRSIIEDSDLARRLGQEGRMTVVRDYQLSSVIEQCLELYRHLLMRRKSANVLQKIPLALGGRKDK